MFAPVCSPSSKADALSSLASHVLQQDFDYLQLGLNQQLTLQSSVFRLPCIWTAKLCGVVRVLSLTALLGAAAQTATLLRYVDSTSCYSVLFLPKSTIAT
jgi:hypothetical protein